MYWHFVMVDKPVLDDDCLNQTLQAEVTPCSHKLRSITDVPRFLRFNPYIRSGYRHTPHPITSTLQHIISSTFSWHNEVCTVHLSIPVHKTPIYLIVCQSINIWTHTFALILFTFLALYELLNGSAVRWGVLVACVSCMVVFIGSVAYHSNMSRCRCESEYHSCLNYDVLGVLLGLSLCAVSPLVHGYRCNSVMMVVLAVATFSAVAVFVGFRVLRANVTPAMRGKYIALLGAMRGVLIALLVGGNAVWHARTESLTWHTGSLLLLIIGGAINVSKCPERWVVKRWVEWIDCISMCGNSHQIWHVMTIAVCLGVYGGCVWDDRYWEITFCE